MTEQPPVGIDLGTTFSCVGIWRNNQVEIIANQEGDRTTPSYVSYKNNDILVGKPALQLLVMNPTNTIYDMKRLIGNKNAIDCIYKNSRYWKFKVLHEPDVKVEIKVNNQIKHIKPEEVSAEILTKLKKSAEEVTRTPVKNVVLSVPAYFDEQQKKTTIKAAEMVGLNVLELISEPSAAAYAYGYDQTKVSNINLLVFDFGGGTLDVVIVKVKNGNFDVVAIGGNTQLGGRDFDNILMDYFLNIIENKYKKDVTNNDRLLPKLLRECIDLKHMLTATEEANLFLGEIFDGIEENIEMDRSIFNKLCFLLYQRIEMVIQGTLKEANMETTEIDEIILVGGSSRIPEIKKLLSEMFTDKPLNCSLNPDEAIARGATIRATQIQNQAIMDIKLSETNAKRLPKLLPNFKDLSINYKAKNRSLNDTDVTPTDQEAPNDTGIVLIVQEVPKDTYMNSKFKKDETDKKEKQQCENNNPQSNINSTDQVNVTLIETLPNNQSKVERRDISPNGVVNPGIAHHNNQIHDHRTEIPQPVPSHRTESVDEKTKPGNLTVVGNFVNFPSKQASSTTNLVKPPPNPVASGTSYGPQNREPLRANSKDKEPFMDSPIKRKLYEETRVWYNKIQYCRHLSDEEKANYQTNYCNNYIQRLRDNYLEESKNVGEEFLFVAERRYQELKYKNDILEQFEKIREKLKYISNEDLKRRCALMLNARRLKVNTSIKNNEKILENFLKDIQNELCLRPATLKNPAQNLKPKVFEWLELEIRKTLIMPKLYDCKYEETKRYRVYK